MLHEDCDDAYEQGVKDGKAAATSTSTSMSTSTTPPTFDAVTGTNYKHLTVSVYSDGRKVTVSSDAGAWPGIGGPARYLLLSVSGWQSNDELVVTGVAVLSLSEATAAANSELGESAVSYTWDAGEGGTLFNQDGARYDWASDKTPSASISFSADGVSYGVPTVLDDYTCSFVDTTAS